MVMPPHLPPTILWSFIYFLAHLNCYNKIGFPNVSNNKEQSEKYAQAYEKSMQLFTEILSYIMEISGRLFKTTLERIKKNKRQN